MSGNIGIAFAVGERGHAIKASHDAFTTESAVKVAPLF